MSLHAWVELGARRRLALTVALALAVLAAPSCRRTPEKLYEGLPLQVWAQRLESADPDERLDALKVLTSARRDAAALQDRIRTIARTDPHRDIRFQAVCCLDSMGANIAEFQAFLDSLTQPPEEGESYVPAETEFEDDISEKASGEDDLQYLKELEEGVEESETTSVAPSDTEAVQELAERQRAAEIGTLVNQMRNPRVLATLLTGADAAEQRYAAQILAEMSGDDPVVLEALEKAASSPDTLVRTLARRALEKWKPY